MSWAPHAFKGSNPEGMKPARNCVSVRSTAYFRQRVAAESMAAERFSNKYGVNVVPAESPDDPASQLATTKVLHAKDNHWSQAHRRRWARSDIRWLDQPDTRSSPPPNEVSQRIHRSWAVTDSSLDKWRTDAFQGHETLPWVFEGYDGGKAVAAKSSQQGSMSRPSPSRRSRSQASRTQYDQGDAGPLDPILTISRPASVASARPSEAPRKFGASMENSAGKLPSLREESIVESSPASKASAQATPLAAAIALPSPKPLSKGDLPHPTMLDHEFSVVQPNNMADGRSIIELGPEDSVSLAMARKGNGNPGDHAAMSAKLQEIEEQLKVERQRREELEAKLALVHTVKQQGQGKKPKAGTNKNALGIGVGSSASPDMLRLRLKQFQGLEKSNLSPVRRTLGSKSISVERDSRPGTSQAISRSVSRLLSTAEAIEGRLSRIASRQSHRN